MTRRRKDQLAYLEHASVSLRQWETDSKTLLPHQYHSRPSWFHRLKRGKQPDVAQMDTQESSNDSGTRDASTPRTGWRKLFYCFDKKPAPMIRERAPSMDSSLSSFSQFRSRKHTGYSETSKHRGSSKNSAAMVHRHGLSKTSATTAYRHKPSKKPSTKNRRRGPPIEHPISMGKQQWSENDFPPAVAIQKRRKVPQFSPEESTWNHQVSHLRDWSPVSSHKMNSGDEESLLSRNFPRGEGLLTSPSPSSLTSPSLSSGAPSTIYAATPDTSTLSPRVSPLGETPESRRRGTLKVQNRFFTAAVRSLPKTENDRPAQNMPLFSPIKASTEPSFQDQAFQPRALFTPDPIARPPRIVRSGSVDENKQAWGPALDRAWDSEELRRLSPKDWSATDGQTWVMESKPSSVSASASTWSTGRSPVGKWAAEQAQEKTTSPTKKCSSPTASEEVCSPDASTEHRTMPKKKASSAGTSSRKTRRSPREGTWAAEKPQRTTTWSDVEAQDTNTWAAETYTSPPAAVRSVEEMCSPEASIEQSPLLEHVVSSVDASAWNTGRSPRGKWVAEKAQEPTPWSAEKYCSPAASPQLASSPEFSVEERPLLEDWSPHTEWTSQDSWFEEVPQQAKKTCCKCHVEIDPSELSRFDGLTITTIKRAESPIEEVNPYAARTIKSLDQSSKTGQIARIAKQLGKPPVHSPYPKRLDTKQPRNRSIRPAVDAEEVSLMSLDSQLASSTNEGASAVTPLTSNRYAQHLDFLEKRVKKVEAERMRAKSNEYK